MEDVPNAAGIPVVQFAADHALPGVPAMYLIPVLFWNTHDSQTVCPEVTVTGLKSEMVCQPATELTTVEAVTPSLEEGNPA